MFDMIMLKVVTNMDTLAETVTKCRKCPFPAASPDDN
jgi:hypothetical protein